VLFQLTTRESCGKDLTRFDAHVWTPLDRGISRLEECCEEANNALGVKNVIYDQWIRMRALRCWLRTQRSVAAWVVSVHGFLEAKNFEDAKAMTHCQSVLNEMMLEEIVNSEELIKLLASGIEFMATTDQEETPLIHGRNLKELLQKRIRLMRAHLHDEPWIDPEYIERRASERSN